MRSQLLLAALLAGAAGSNAQDPLSVDPAFVAPFDPDMGVEGGGLADVVRLSDGNFLVSGAFRFAGDLTWYNACVLEANGDLVSNGFYGTYVGGGTIRPWNDQLYIGTANQYIRRLDHQGHIDTGFVHGRNAIVLAQGGGFVVQPDGGILQVGAILWPQSGPIHGLMRFTATGAVDTTYQHRLSNGNIYTLFPTGDGRYWCSGVMTEYDGQPVPGFFRIWPNGDLDTSFHSAVETGWVHDVHVQADGKVILGGAFKVTGVSDTLYLVRLLPDGALDGSFHNGNHLEYYDPDLFAFIPYVRSILPLDEAHLLIGGGFWTVDGERRGLLAVIDSAGNLDPVLAAYYGCDSVSGGPDNDREIGNVLWMGSLDDGYVHIGGVYTGFNDGLWHPDQRMITRLHPLTVGMPERGAPPPSLTVASDPGSSSVMVRSALWPGGIITIMDSRGSAVKQQLAQSDATVIRVAGLAAGIYIVELSVPGHAAMRAKWINE